MRLVVSRCAVLVFPENLGEVAFHHMPAIPHHVDKERPVVVAVAGLPQQAQVAVR